MTSHPTLTINPKEETNVTGRTNTVHMNQHLGVIAGSTLESIGWVGNRQYVRVKGDKSRAMIMGGDFDAGSASVPAGKVLVRFVDRTPTGRTFDMFRSAQPVEAGAYAAAVAKVEAERDYMPRPARESPGQRAVIGRTGVRSGTDFYHSSNPEP
jgi:hypothetical protein